MVPAKDCKARLYEMFNDGLFKLTELSKASDHAPSRTFYLFNVDIYEIAKKLLQNAYTAMMNLMIRREHLTGENRRLLEKSKKVNAMIESLVAQSAEAAEIEDVRAMITPEETKQLDLVTSHCNKFETFVTYFCLLLLFHVCSSSQDRNGRDPAARGHFRIRYVLLLSQYSATAGPNQEITPIHKKDALSIVCKFLSSFIRLG